MKTREENLLPFRGENHLIGKEEKISLGNSLLTGVDF